MAHLQSYFQWGYCTKVYVLSKQKKDWGKGEQTCALKSDYLVVKNQNIENVGFLQQFEHHRQTSCQT